MERIDFGGPPTPKLPNEAKHLTRVMVCAKPNTTLPLRQDPHLSLVPVATEPMRHAVLSVMAGSLSLLRCNRAGVMYDVAVSGSGH